MLRPQPLLSFEVDTSRLGQVTTIKDDEFDSDETQKTWKHYVLLCLLVVLMVAPHPPLLIILVNHYLRILHEPMTFIFHLLITYTLAFLAFSSLIVCVARDPGPVFVDDSDQDSDGRCMGLTEALISTGSDDDPTSPARFCRRCWMPKPERAHHCNACGRCVLKMDHHCPWLGSKCVGHRTYPAFIHFLTCITALSTYIAIISASAFWWSLKHPFLVLDQVTPIYELFLASFGACVTLTVGSFLVYHIHLITTNQTTVEVLSPFLLLRYIPPLPAHMKLSDPPMEEELSSSQRKVVRKAHKSLRMYDVGWRRNWAQVFGWSKPHGWISRLAIGGSGKGDGRSFPRNPRSQEMLSQLAAHLEKET